MTLDRLLGYPKHLAVTHAARTLAPEYIICDEISTEEEVRAMSYALGTGVKLIATVHAGSPEEFRERRITRELHRGGIISIGLCSWIRAEIPGNVHSALRSEKGVLPMRFLGAASLALAH